MTNHMSGIRVNPMESQEVFSQLSPHWRHPVKLAYTKTEVETLDEFSASRDFFNQVIEKLRKPDSLKLRHDETENLIHKDGQELCRLLFQASLDVQTHNETKRHSVKGSDEVLRTYFRRSCKRQMESMFGAVSYLRNGYSHPMGNSIYPLDEALNMPKKKYTHGLGEAISLAVCQNAFDGALEGVSQLIAGHMPKRQAEQLVSESSMDFEAFYVRRGITPVMTPDNILVMSQDGKGIIMRHEDLKEATKKAAEKGQHTLSTRLSSGEKRNRKRMATVATVYDVVPHLRTSDDVIGRQGEDETKQRNELPKAENKRVWASIEENMEQVTEAIVQEAMRRDPNRERPWVMLVDGHKDQIEVIKRVFKRHDIQAPLILDFIHVLEYLWRAAWCFFDSTDKPQAKEAEKWVMEKAKDLLDGRSGGIAAGIRIKAKYYDLSEKKQETIDTVAKYLTNHTDMLRYDTYMKSHCCPVNLQYSHKNACNTLNTKEI